MNEQGHEINYVDSPAGLLEVRAVLQHIHEIRFTEPSQKKKVIPGPFTHKAAEQLREYFAGKRSAFDLPLMHKGTEFQQSVWKAVQEIPAGKTCTYTELAVKLRAKELLRAVGQANGKNKIAIVIPCHRVMGAGNVLTGYAWGTERKKWLLNFEREYYGSANPSELF